MRDLDIQMKTQQCEIILVGDNCPTHPHITVLDNVQLVFLPPNTTDSTDQLDDILDKMHRHVDIPAEVDGQWFATFNDDMEVANTLMDR